MPKKTYLLVIDKMSSDRGNHWLLTWNNPPTWKMCDDKDASLEIVPWGAKHDNGAYVVPHFNECIQNEWLFDGQLEVGEQGTPHYQFYINTQKQVRFSAIKKAFPESHIECTHDVKKVESYCKKWATRQTDTTKTVKIQRWDPDSDERYTTKMFWTDLSEIWFDCYEETDTDIMLVYDYCVQQLIDLEFPCHMVAVQPQNRKAFQLYGLQMMNYYRRILHNETPAPQQPDRELHEAKPAECPSDDEEESGKESEEGESDASADSGSEQTTEQSDSD